MYFAMGITFGASALLLVLYLVLLTAKLLRDE